MNENLKDITAFIIMLFLLIGISIFILIFSSIYIFSTEHKIIDGNLIDYDIVLDNWGGIDYIVFTFDNNDVVKARINNAFDSVFYDFTNGSHIVIDFYKYVNFDGDIWTVNSIMKVPDIN